MRCERCGREFTCGTDAQPAGPPCWCAELPQLKNIQPGRNCLCADCLRDALRREEEQRQGAA